MRAFAGIPKSPGNSWCSAPRGFFYIHRARIADLALRGGLSTMFDVRGLCRCRRPCQLRIGLLELMELTGNYRRPRPEGREAGRSSGEQQATKFES